MPNLKVTWASLSGGGAQTDALLSGNVDIVNTGVGNLLLLWDRTKGGVKGIVANSALPLTLITRNANIKTLKDYTANDRIAVPTLKVSTQAILLQMASEKTFGADQMTKLDANTVQLGHPDAAIMMANPQGEVTSHFAAPPYSYFELKNVKGAHVVLVVAGYHRRAADAVAILHDDEVRRSQSASHRRDQGRDVRGDRLHQEGHAGRGGHLSRNHEGQDERRRYPRHAEAARDDGVDRRRRKAR